MNKKLCTYSILILSFSFLTLSAEVQAGLVIDHQFTENNTFTLTSSQLSGSGYLYTSSDNTLFGSFTGKSRVNTANALNEVEGGSEFLFTHIMNNTIIGLKIEGAGQKSQFTGTETSFVRFAIPLTFNGETLSCFVSPYAETNFRQAGYTATGFSSYLSFLLDSFVIKPGLDGSVSRETETLRLYTICPGLRISWYPEFPIATGLSTEYRFLSDSSDNDTISLYGIKVFAILSPVDWLLVTARSDFYYSDPDVSSETSLELAFYVVQEKDRSISIPLHVRHFYSSAVLLEIGAGIRFAF